MMNHRNFKRSENFPHFYHFAVGVVKHGYRSLALEIIHILAPAPLLLCRLPGWCNQFLMPLSLLTDARGEKRSEVESSPRTTQYAPGMEMSPLDQFFSHAVGCAQRHSEGLVQLFSLFPEQQRATGVWGLEMLTLVTLFRPVFHLHSMNYIWSGSSIRDTSAAACQYITHRCRIINPSCHSQGFLIWLAATLKVIAYSPPLGPLMQACQGEITHCRCSPSAAQSIVCVPVSHRRAGRRCLQQLLVQGGFGLGGWTSAQ